MEIIVDDFEYDVSPVKAYSNAFKPKNPLNRPNVGFKNAILALICFFVLQIFLFFAVKYALTKPGVCEHKILYTLLAMLGFGILYILIILKKAALWLVRVYQHYAPDRVRLKCVFEPSCSEYMILAIEKYGAFKGIYKGICRLLRCHAPGGVDYP